jgi:hypothetical protein
MMGVQGTLRLLARAESLFLGVVMAARPPERILDDIVQKRGRGAPVRRKLAVNKERNWLLGVTLNSFAKLADGAQLTDLEQSIVTAFRQNGFSDEEIKQQGQLDKRIPQQVRAEIFPTRFARLDPSKSYSFEDLRRDAPDIVDAILERPNVTRVDVQAIHAGNLELRDFPLVDRSVLREHASEMLVAIAPNVTPPNPTFTIKATSFKCIDRQTDSIFGPSNEPYWIFGSLGGGTTVTTRSQIFGDVDNGESRTFASNEGCIWGQNCAAQDLPDGEIGSLVSLWEHDEGNVEKIRAGVAAAFAAAAGILAATGVAAWVGAVVAGVGAVVAWLLGFLDDDHIADQTFVFTREVVQKQLPNVGQSFNLTRRFADGDGDYSLNIRVARVS